MSVRKKIHEDSDFNNAEKAAENILHWFIENRNKAIGYAALIVLIVAGLGSISYVQEKKEATAKTEFGSIFIEQQKTGSFNIEQLEEIYSSTTENTFAAYAAYMLANLALEKGDLETAEEWFANSLSKKPVADFVVSGIYEGKGVIAEANDQTDEAIKLYKKAISSNKSSFRVNDVRMKIALLYKKDGKHESMKVECEQILEDSAASPVLKQAADNLLLTQL